MDISGHGETKGRLSSLAGCFGDLTGCGTLTAPAQAGVWDSASPPALPTLRSTSPEYGGAESLLLTSPPLSLGGTPQPPTPPQAGPQQLSAIPSGLPRNRLRWVSGRGPASNLPDLSQPCVSPTGSLAGPAWPCVCGLCRLRQGLPLTPGAGGGPRLLLTHRPHLPGLPWLLECPAHRKQSPVGGASGWGPASWGLRAPCPPPGQGLLPTPRRPHRPGQDNLSEVPSSQGWGAHRSAGLPIRPGGTRPWVQGGAGSGPVGALGIEDPGPHCSRTSLSCGWLSPPAQVVRGKGRGGAGHPRPITVQ